MSLLGRGQPVARRACRGPEVKPCRADEGTAWGWQAVPPDPLGLLAPQAETRQWERLAFSKCPVPTSPPVDLGG